MGNLVNCIFCRSRMSDRVVKQAHFQHGALFVYRRLLEYLINSPNAEKLAKKNVLNLLAGI